MPNRKTPGREAFRNEFSTINNDLPRDYSVRIMEILQNNGYLRTLAAELASSGRDNRKGIMLYIQNVRKGHTVDWKVLAAFQQLAREVKKATSEAVAA